MQSIATWLEELGLGQYAAHFVANGIDFSVLPYLNDDDLKGLDILLGHRRKISRCDRATILRLGGRPRKSVHAVRGANCVCRRAASIDGDVLRSRRLDRVSGAA